MGVTVDLRFGLREESGSEDVGLTVAEEEGRLVGMFKALSRASVE
jgi:hypothetical protein